MADTIFTHSGGGAQTPATDDDSGGQSQSLGMRFQCTTSGYQVVGGSVWVPASGIPSGCEWNLWDTTSPGSPIAVFSLNSAPAGPGWYDFAITPVTLTGSRDYVVDIYYPAGSHRYVFTSGGSLPVGTGTLSADTGRYAVDNHVIPGSSFAGYFFADVQVAPPSIVVAVNPAAEIDVALSIGVIQTVSINTASEIDAALTVGVSVVANVGTAAEIDSALSIGVNQSISVGTAAEIDSALPIAAITVQIIAVGTAAEIDAALPIGASTGGGTDVTDDLSSTYLLNVLAGTIVNGVPTLTAKAAASVWAGLVMGAEEAWSYNVQAGNSLPNWRALQGVLNQLAGTTNLSAQACLQIIVET